MLETRVAELVRRGLHREYLTTDEELRCPRGKIDVSAHVKRALRPSGRVACVVDELSYDVPLNQIVRATLEKLAVVVVDPALRRRMQSILTRMPETSRMSPTPADFAKVRLHRVTGHYRFVLRLCELVLNCLVPERGGAMTFVNFTDDERQMGLLFEAFVRNFLIHEQADFAVARDTLRWELTPLTSGSGQVVPRMQTDITLSRQGLRCVIETKCTRAPLRAGMRDGRRRLQEKHLYQLFAYLEHMEMSGQRADVGMLLYAAGDERFDHRYRIRGKELRATCLDLNQPWQGIKADLLSLGRSLVGNAQASVA